VITKKGGNAHNQQMESLRYHALFGLARSAAGCTARDVDVSQREPIRGEAIQADRTITESEQSKKIVWEKT